MTSYNKELAKEKGLIINEDTTKYDKLVKNYKYLLEYYINTKIDLKKYDNYIKNSELGIGINPKYRPLNEYLALDHIFFINNLFVEKLSTSDVDKILNNFDITNISSELLEIIERTYKDVIYDNYFKGEYQNAAYKVCYGSAIPSNFVDNNSLVFKIYYGKNTINLDGDEFIKLHEKQLAFFKELIKSLKEEIKEKLNVNCDILLEKDIY